MSRSNGTASSNKKHPDFRMEKRRLDATVAWVDEFIERLKNSNTGSSGDPRADRQAVKMKQDNIRNFETYRLQPYFGKIDYWDDTSGKVKTAYIGSFNSRAIGTRTSKLEPPVERQDSGLAEVFENPQAGEYTPTKGAEPKPIRVLLKRVFTIENGQLLDIEDVFQHDSAFGSGKVAEHEELSRVDSPVLAVQSAAGSGGRSALLNRLDYLMSPFSNANAQVRPNADKVMVFGPTQAYADSVTGMMSETSLRHVKVDTVSGWMARKFRSRVSVRETDGILESLMSGNEASDLVEAHRFKGELQIKQLMDRFTDGRIRDLRATAEEFVSCLPSDLRSSKNAVTAAFRGHPEPNAARQVFIDGLAERWMKRNGDPNANKNELKKRAIAAAEEALSFWPELDTFSEYVSLMSRPAEIRTHGRGKVERELAYKISLTVPATQTRSLTPTDLAAALYLDHRINGFTSELFEHVVVDEAQDISPMELEIVRMHSANGKFTILGDLRQRLLPHKGLPNWNVLRNIFGRSNVIIHQMRQAHSTTKQIALHNNRILSSTVPGVRKPTPSGRTGRRPSKRYSTDGEEMRRSLLKYLRNLLRLDDVDSVGILTKRHQTALALANFLKGNGVETVHYLARDGVAEKGVTLSPILLAKGLEFDAVIVANVDERNFNDTEFNRALLYIACSRARHYLEIHIQGKEPAIVP